MSIIATVFVIVIDVGGWLATLRRFLIFIATGNLAWEIAQLPLYTIWYEGTPGELAFAVAHCTGGDILIASASLLLALLLVARPTWPDETYRRVAALTVAFAVPYTVFSEWLNTEVRGSWAYSSKRGRGTPPGAISSFNRLADIVSALDWNIVVRLGKKPVRSGPPDQLTRASMPRSGALSCPP